MKRILSLLFICIANTMAAWSMCQETFNASDDHGDVQPYAGPYSIRHDGISIDVSHGLWSNSQFRIYKNQTITICSSVGDIIAIEFYCVGQDDGQYGPGNFTTSSGGYSYGGDIGNWQGRETCVTFVATHGQVRITKIVVTYDCESGLLPPIITPKSGTYYQSIDVSMWCATDGAEIHYTTNGSTPTTASARYTAPFTLHSDATVQAVSVLDGEMSSVVRAAYVFTELPDVCLGDLDVLDNNERVVFNHEATVLCQSGYNLYLRDNCDGVYGYGLIYGNTGQTYQTGEVIPPGWGGTKTAYDGHAELTNLTGFQPASRTEDIVPELITIPQISEEKWAHYVTLRGVYVDQEHQLVIDQQGNSIPYHPQLSYTVSPTQIQDIKAIVTSYKSNLQLLIIEEPSIIPPPPGVCCFADLYEYDKGQVAEFECPLTAIYQNGSNLYAKDSCGECGLIYGYNAGGLFVNGDQIIGRASWTEYQGNKQVTNDGEWTKIGKTDPVEPIVLPVENLSLDMVYLFVKLERVSLVEDGYGLLAEDETGSVFIYNRFGVEIEEDMGGELIPNDPNGDNEVNIADVNELIKRILSGRTTPEWVGGDGTYDIIGFITVYNDSIEIYPIRIVHHGGQYVLIGDVNGDGELNIADVNCIIRIILEQ